MMGLSSHGDTELVTRGELINVPLPDATSTFKPIPHFELVDMLDKVLYESGIKINDEKFALRRDGQMLFGVLDLEYGEMQDGRAMLGLRTANNRQMSLQICAGLSVFVCDNMVFRGDLIALQRKHTSGLNLKTELTFAVAQFKEHFGQLTGEIEQLKQRELSDVHAKALMHDVFVKDMMPGRFLPEVSHEYFKPRHQEFEPRNAWSLHNAFTEVAKAMPITTRMLAIQRIGKFFGMAES